MPPSSEAQAQAGGTQQVPPQPQVMSDEVFAQLVSGIGSFVSRAAMGQPTNDTISDFFNQLGQRQAQGEGGSTCCRDCLSAVETSALLDHTAVETASRYNSLHVPDNEL